MTKPLIILGGGGHAAVLVDILRGQGKSILAVVSPQNPFGRKVFSGITHWEDDSSVFCYPPEQVELVNGMGSLPGSSIRQKLYEQFTSCGYVFSKVIADSAVVSPYANLAAGVQVMHNAVVQTGAEIFENSIVNTAAVVEHDCRIGKHNHVAPRAALSGGVLTGECVHIGTGAVVIQGISISDHSIIGAGASLCRDVISRTIVYPARPFVKIL